MHELGLIVGKFCPLHKGHELLISQAQAQCKQLYILSYTLPEFPGCEPEKRKQWLKQTAPDAEVLVLDNGADMPKNTAPNEVHRRFSAQIIQRTWELCPDVIFTSEDYGDGFAAFLANEFQKSVEHICVDITRSQVPISGTRIRQNVHAHRQSLPPHVYAAFVETVCFIGAESTGKSSLSKALARIYSTNYVEEYGRTLWMEKDGHLDFDDYMKIARTHTAMEDKARQSANQYVFIDTSPLTTLFYALDQFTHADQSLTEMSERAYDHVFLCHPDFPMVQDGWRSDENFRHTQHEWYTENLESRKINYTNLTGSFDDKIETVKFHLSQTTTKQVQPQLQTTPQQ